MTSTLLRIEGMDVYYMTVAGECVTCLLCALGVGVGPYAGVSVTVWACVGLWAAYADWSVCRRMHKMPDALRILCDPNSAGMTVVTDMYVLAASVVLYYRLREVLRTELASARWHAGYAA